MRFALVFSLFVILGTGIVIVLLLARRCIGGFLHWIALWPRTRPWANANSVSGCFDTVTRKITLSLAISNISHWTKPIFTSIPSLYWVWTLSAFAKSFLLTNYSPYDIAWWCNLVSTLSSIGSIFSTGDLSIYYYRPHQAHAWASFTWNNIHTCSPSSTTNPYPSLPTWTCFENHSTTTWTLMPTLLICYDRASLSTSCFLIAKIFSHCHHPRNSSVCYDWRRWFIMMVCVGWCGGFWPRWLSRLIEGGCLCNLSRRFSDCAWTLSTTTSSFSSTAHYCQNYAYSHCNLSFSLSTSHYQCVGSESLSAVC